MDITQIAQLDPAQLAVLGVITAGATELLNRLRAKDFWVVGTILTSVVIGAVVGVNYGLELLSGIALGFATPGALTLAGQFGNKSTPAKSELLEK